MAILSAVLVGVLIRAAGDQIFRVIPAAFPYYLCVYLLNLSLRGIFELDDERLDEHRYCMDAGGRR